MLAPTARVATENGKPVAPERALLSSVLMNAIECFHKHHRATTHRRWQPFSFDEVCEFLSLDPECLRTGLRHWYEPQHSGSEPHEWMT